MASIDWVKYNVLFCPVTVFELEVNQWFENAGNIKAACSGKDMDDVVVGARGLYYWPGWTVCVVKVNRFFPYTTVAEIFVDVDGACRSSVGSYDKTVCTITCDGAETGSFAFNASFCREP